MLARRGSMLHVLDCCATRMTPLSTNLWRKKERASSSSAHEPTTAFPDVLRVSNLVAAAHTRAGLPWDPARWSQRWLQLGYEWAKLLWSRCLWRAPFSRRGEAKLNKYLLHPVCIKGLHTWLWRQSDIKQGGVAQPAPTGTCTRAHALAYTRALFHSLLLKSLSFVSCQDPVSILTFSSLFSLSPSLGDISRMSFVQYASVFAFNLYWCDSTCLNTYVPSIGISVWQGRC